MSLTRMDVEIKIPVYEINGDDKGVKYPIIVQSHWNRHGDFVVLKIGEKSYTVAADALKTAVGRATW